MDYRRGLQRVYAVLTVAWVFLILFVTPAERLKFWKASPPTPPTLTDADFAADAAGQAIPTFEQFKAHQNKQKFVPPPPIEDPPQSEQGSWTKYQQPATDGAWQAAAKSGDWKIWTDAGGNQTESRTRKGLSLAGTLFGPPVLGYAAIFFVVPWVYRGFLRSTQV